MSMASIMCGNITGSFTNAAGATVPATITFPQSFGILGASWLELTGLALLSSLFILVLVYMVANFLRNQQLLSWTKFELFQILGTAITVLFVVLAIVPGMCGFNMSFMGSTSSKNLFSSTDASTLGADLVAHNIGNSLDAGTVAKINSMKNGDYLTLVIGGKQYLVRMTGGKLNVFSSDNPYVGPDGTPMNMYDIVDNYFSRVEKVGYLLFGYMMYAIKVVNIIARITWTSNPLGIGSTDSPLEAASQINSIFFLMFSGYVTSFLLLQFQMRMLDYLAVAVMWYLFPFGIFLRAFEPTRTFGGMLIGLSIALFLFYPIIMVFNSYIIDRSGLSQELQSDVAAATADANGQVQSGANLPNGGAKDLNPSGLTDLPTMKGLSNGITGGVLVLFKPAMLYAIAAVVLPVLNFIVLVEIVRGASAFFGEEIDVSNLTRLI